MSSYAPFTLASVDKLGLWLQNGVEITTAKWTDQSGNNNHATQTSDSQQAAVSGGGLDFDGTNDFYELTNNISISENQGFCLAAVVELDVVDNATITADDTSAKAQMTIVDTTDFKFKAADATTTTFVFPSNTFNTSKMLIMLNRTASASNRFTFLKNGSPLTADVDNSVNEAIGENPKAFDFTYLGAIGTAPEQFFNGKIYELAFWSKGLNTQEIADVNSYLQDIHGL